MKKKQKVYRFLSLLVALMLVTVGVFGCGGEDSDVTKIRVSHQPEFETYQTYAAIEEGLDKEAGIELDLLYFDSGMPQIEALPANQWDVGATGGVPMLMAALRYDAYMIGLANDESKANVIMVRPDSPVMNTKGANPEYPEIYGTADDVRGKTILVTTVSSGHYALSAYLKALGLTEDDVKIQNLEQAQAVAAFESGKGDILVVWTPFAYTGLKKGWQVAASSDQVGAGVPLVLVANKNFADEHPDQVVKFLDVFFQSLDNMKKEQTNLAEPYQKFLKDWAAIEISKEDAALDIEWHPVYNLEEQLVMFDSSNGPSDMENTMTGIAEFFTEQGKFTPEEKEKVMNSGFVTGKFLEMLAEEKGIQ